MVRNMEGMEARVLEIIRSTDIQKFLFADMLSFERAIPIPDRGYTDDKRAHGTTSSSKDIGALAPKQVHTVVTFALRVTDEARLTRHMLKGYWRLLECDLTEVPKFLMDENRGKRALATLRLDLGV